MLKGQSITVVMHGLSVRKQELLSQDIHESNNEITYCELNDFDPESCMEATEVMAVVADDPDIDPSVLFAGYQDLILPAIIIASAETLADKLSAFIKAENKRCLQWSLSTQAAYKWPALSDEFVRHVASLARHAPAEQCLIDMRVATQEAVTNAILHGNLGVGSMEDEPFSGDLALYYDTVEQRMQDPNCTSKTVSLIAEFTDRRIDIFVRDEGLGNQNALRTDFGSNALSGRGTLMMINSTNRFSVQVQPSVVLLGFDV